MNLFGWLSSAPKVADDVFDKDSGHLAKVGAWIGNQSFTEEEAQEMNQNIAKGVQKFAIDTLSESTDRSKARRKIAVFTIQFYCGLLFMAGITYPIDKDWSAMWLDIASTPGLAVLVAGVAAFFFGVHYLRAKGKK